MTMALLRQLLRERNNLGKRFLQRVLRKRGLCTADDNGLPKYEIRAMKRSDIQSLYDLLAENRWNMERSYLECVFNTDPTGLVVVVDENDQVIGHNGILAHSDKLASSGMNIMKEEYRKYGIGKQLFRQVMDVMQDRNIGGTSLSNRVTFYAQFGWTIKSYTIHYNAGPVNRDFIRNVHCEDIEIVPLSEVNISDFIAYDSEIHTISRAVYICSWAQWEKAKSYVALRHGRICGYGVLRPADVGHKMFPLFADEPKIARALFAKLVEHLPKDEPVVYANAVDNDHSNEVVAANKFTTYLSMTRLYNKWNVPVDLRRVYSVSSTEYAIV